MNSQEQIETVNPAESELKSQFHLFAKRRFLPFFVTQFLGALNDNLFKNVIPNSVGGIKIFNVQDPYIISQKYILFSNLHLILQPTKIFLMLLRRF